jgi:hypothetical protein
MAPLLRVQLDVLDVEVGMLDTSFKQRRVTIIGAKGQRNFCFSHEQNLHEQCCYRQSKPISTQAVQSGSALR